MEKGKLIGIGRTARVYQWTDDTVIKIFNDSEPNNMIEQEINNTRTLQNCTFKFPQFIEKLQYEGKRAVVYEKVEGISMMKLMEIKPFKYREFAKKLAHLHLEIHKNHVKGIREQKQYFKERVSRANELKDDIKEKMYKLIDGLPKGDSLCHSDFHPDNIICNESGDYIIDWADCCHGNPCGDVARTILTLKTAELPEGISPVTKALIMFIRNRFCSIYTKEYLRISGKTAEQIDEWQVAVAAYRLCAARKTEKSKIMKIINSYMEKASR